MKYTLKPEWSSKTKVHPLAVSLHTLKRVWGSLITFSNIGGLWTTSKHCKIPKLPVCHKHAGLRARMPGFTFNKEANLQQNSPYCILFTVTAISLFDDKQTFCKHSVLHKLFVTLTHYLHRRPNRNSLKGTMLCWNVIFNKESNI
jgi:hypothetical protein